MRIALIHSFYRSENPSGENAVVLRQFRALQDAGHEVVLIARHTDAESRRRLYALRSAIAVAAGTGPDPTHELKDFDPHVVHVHNLFPNFGERWLGRWTHSPVVATMHNFRSICTNGLLFRHGQTCLLCIGGDTRPAIRHRCYRNSLPATLPLALHNAGGLEGNRLVRRADRVIVLSQRSRILFAGAGGDRVASKLVVLPNGIEDRSTSPVKRTLDTWVFVGRLSPEKGIGELIRTWPAAERLTVVGDGPLRQEMESRSSASVAFLGALTQDQVDSVLRSALGLVFPSRWMETGGPPLVVAEALMHGVPVVARAGSGGSDFVERTGSGVVYQSDAGLVDALNRARTSRETLAERSRSAYVSQLSLDAWVRGLKDVYQSVTGMSRHRND